MIRVHETDNASTVAFNLDDWMQVDSYVRTLAANVGTRLLAAGSPNMMQIGGPSYSAKLESQTRGTVDLTAEPVAVHGNCYTCYCYFDRTAGNGTYA
jgi:hypothetical protein